MPAEYKAGVEAGDGKRRDPQGAQCGPFRCSRRNTPEKPGASRDGDGTKGAGKAESRSEAKSQESSGRGAGEIPVLTRTDSREEKVPEGGRVEKGRIASESF
jgi:hypothetical protein